MEVLATRISPKTNLTIEENLIKDKLHVAILAMAKNKAPNPDGVIIEISTMFWIIIETYFLPMI